VGKNKKNRGTVVFYSSGT